MVGEREHGGRIKVLDFGLAKLADASRESSGAMTMPAGPATEEGRILGTAAYMSPEQAEGKACRRAVGPVFLRRHALRDGHGPAAIHGRHEHLDHLVDRQGYAEADHRPQSFAATRSRTHRSPRADERSRTAIPECEGSAKRTRGAQGVDRFRRAARFARRDSRDRFTGARAFVRRSRLAVGRRCCRGAASPLPRRCCWLRSPSPAPRGAIGDCVAGGRQPGSRTGAWRAGDLARWDHRGADVRKRTEDAPRCSAAWIPIRFDQCRAPMAPGRPFWSPDSRHIGFFAGTTLKRVPLAGGEPVTLCEVGFSRGGAWSTAGTILVGTNYGVGVLQVLGERRCAGSRDPSGPGSWRELAPVSRVPAGRQSVPLLRADRARRESRRLSGVAG